MLPNLSTQSMLYKKYFCSTCVSLRMWTYQQSEGIPKNRFGPILLQHKSVITEIPLGSFSRFFQPRFPSSSLTALLKFLSAHVITTFIPKIPDNGWCLLAVCKQQNPQRCQQMPLIHCEWEGELEEISAHCVSSWDGCWQRRLQAKFQSPKVYLLGLSDYGAVP